MNPRAVNVYRNFKQKESEVLQTNQVKLLQFKIKELEQENKILKKLLKEKL